MPNFKSGFVAIVGRPNVGKSTLLNAMTQEKIAIVSPKPQTTRTKILTIKTTDAYQMVFVDTPGVHRPKTKLGEYMNDVASGAVTDADAAIFVTEAATDKWEQDAEILESIKKRGIPAVLVINKIDAAPKEQLLPQIEKYTNAFSFSAVVPVCAKHGDGVEAVMDEVLALLGEGPMYYPADQLTDQPQKQIAAELVREKVLRFLDKEVPHGTAVEIDSFKDGAGLLKIGATIYCEKETHKAIVIGKGGAMLKRIGQSARGDMESFFGKKVFLQLWVKVKADWRNKEGALKGFGFDK